MDQPRTRRSRQYEALFDVTDLTDDDISTSAEAATLRAVADDTITVGVEDRDG